MATDDQEEYEQGEQVRKWLRSNGSSVIGGIAVGLALIYGWQWWQGEQAMHAEKAAVAYAQVTEAITAGKDAAVTGTLVKGMHVNFANTPYAVLASMRMASHQMEGNDAKGALSTLEGIGKISDQALATIVQLREARLLLILGRPTDALTRIASVNNDAYAPVADEIRGDAEITLGHIDAARKYYADALLKTPAEAPSRALLEMKLTEVGGVVTQPEAKKA